MILIRPNWTGQVCRRRRNRSFTLVFDVLHYISVSELRPDFPIHRRVRKRRQRYGRAKLVKWKMLRIAPVVMQMHETDQPCNRIEQGKLTKTLVQYDR